jgi:uncharacterized protein (TIGR02001 family)
MNRTLTGLFLIGLASLLIPQTARTEPLAEEDKSLSVSGNVGLYSDYLFRGITQTDHDPAIQGGVDLTHSSGLYAGFYGSNVYFPNYSAHLELDVYGGYRLALAKDLSASLGVLHYTYPSTSDFNTLEVPFKLTWGALELGYAFSPDWYSSGGTAGYASAQYGVDLPFEARLSGGAGFSHFSAKTENAGFRNYFDFKLGVSRQFRNVTFGLFGSGVSRMQAAGGTDPRAIFSIGKSF